MKNIKGICKDFTKRFNQNKNRIKDIRITNRLMRSIRSIRRDS